MNSCRPLQEANRSFSRYFRFAAKSFSKVYKQDRGTYPVSLKGPRSQRVLRRGPTEQKQRKLPRKCAQTVLGVSVYPRVSVNGLNKVLNAS